VRVRVRVCVCVGGIIKIWLLVNPTVSCILAIQGLTIYTASVRYPMHCMNVSLIDFASWDCSTRKNSYQQLSLARVGGFDSRDLYR